MMFTCELMSDPASARCSEARGGTNGCRRRRCTGAVAREATCRVRFTR
jgi:hypothetical protein